jgi:hypothetical protein
MAVSNQRKRAYSTPSTRRSLALIDAFDTAWLGFIQHPWYGTAWLGFIQHILHLSGEATNEDASTAEVQNAAGATKEVQRDQAGVCFWACWIDTALAGFIQWLRHSMAFDMAWHGL